MTRWKQIVRVQSGHRLEMFVPELNEGQEVEVEIFAPPAVAKKTQELSVLGFLDSLPAGPRAFASWDEYDEYLRQERDALDR